MRIIRCYSATKATAQLPSAGYLPMRERRCISYTGEGQTGDMQLTKGNLALAEHLNTGKRVFLFEYVQRGYVQYKGELELVDYDFFGAPDRDGQQRAAIKFFFKRKGATLPYEPELEGIMVNEPPAELHSTPPNETERKGLVTSRIGQGAFVKAYCTAGGLPARLPAIPTTRYS
ncbi:hypothetical protein [Niabella aquatica]